MADRGRFISDEECNPSNRDGCARYHEGAVHCFKMVNPRSAFNLCSNTMHFHKLHYNSSTHPRVQTKQIFKVAPQVNSNYDVLAQKSFTLSPEKFITHSTFEFSQDLLPRNFTCPHNKELVNLVPMVSHLTA